MFPPRGLKLLSPSRLRLLRPVATLLPPLMVGIINQTEQMRAKIEKIEIEIYTHYNPLTLMWPSGWPSAGAWACCCCAWSPGGRQGAWPSPPSSGGGSCPGRSPASCCPSALDNDWLLIDDLYVLKGMSEYTFHQRRPIWPFQRPEDLSTDHWFCKTVWRMSISTHLIVGQVNLSISTSIFVQTMSWLASSISYWPMNEFIEVKRSERELLEETSELHSLVYT